MNIRAVVMAAWAAALVGQTWAGWALQTPAAAWSPRDSMGEVVYNGQMWIFGGFAPDRKNDVWRSADGINWIQATAAAPWAARNVPGSLVYDNKMWIMGGAAAGAGPWINDVWWSTDGANWTLATANAPWAARSAFGTAVFDNKMWVIGGMGDDDGTDHYNDVWSSSDGVNWTQVTAAAPWAQRAMLQTVVFDDKIWVIGGGVYDTNQPMNVGPNYADVWYSTDGANWILATSNMEAGDRRFHNSVVYDDEMWIVAGYTSVPTPGNKNDVWHSADGIHWTQLPESPWAYRHEVGLLVFGEKMYVLGGFGNVLYNDVWTYTADAVPEPGTWGLILMGLSGMAWRWNSTRRRI